MKIVPAPGLPCHRHYGDLYSSTLSLALEVVVGCRVLAAGCLVIDSTTYKRVSSYKPALVCGFPYVPTRDLFLGYGYRAS